MGSRSIAGGMGLDAGLPLHRCVIFALRRSLGFALLVTALSGTGGDWPQWRGPLRDGHAAPDETLPETLPPDLAPRWHQPAGGGFASPVVAAGRLFVVEDIDGQETARALQPDTGTEIWRTPYARTFGDEWGSGPRCTPLADDSRLYVQSMRGEFACLDQADGRRLWHLSFEADYGVHWEGGNDASDSASRRRGHNGAPVIVGTRIYVAVGSTRGASVVCFDKATGSEVWRAGSDETAYAALMSGRLAGREQVIAYTAGGLVGFGLDRGEILWRAPLRTAANRHVVTPILNKDTVTVSSHTIGLRSYHIDASGAGLTASLAWSKPALKTSLATLVQVGGHLYGQGPDQNFLCVQADTGSVKWSQPGFGERPLVGYTATLAAGDRLLALTDGGQLVLIAADPEKYRELGRVQICGRTWNHPALAGGRIYLRDRRQLLAVDLLPASKGQAGR